MAQSDSVTLEERLIDLAIDLLDAVMSSASTDDIRPRDWWIRARAALETAASSAEDFPGMASKMAGKLQIQAYKARAASSIYSLARNKDIRRHFSRFREICERDAIYIAALTQARRDERREAMKEGTYDD